MGAPLHLVQGVIMNTREDPYVDMRPIHGEARYVEYDLEFSCWAIFGADSGFCYGQYTTEGQANGAL